MGNQLGPMLFIAVGIAIGWVILNGGAASFFSKLQSQAQGQQGSSSTAPSGSPGAVSVTPGGFQQTLQTIAQNHAALLDALGKTNVPGVVQTTPTVGSLSLGY